MENFNYFMPTKMMFGSDVVKRELGNINFGKKALIVTGKTSAKLCGALDDVLQALNGEYAIFDQVGNNPTVENVLQGGKFARENSCDYVIAIGGGSPLDAAKVIAILAVNDVHPLDLYKSGWQNEALPIIAIPTTSGTGSEVTQYAVLTIEESETKKGLGGPDLFPKVAFLDPEYTDSLPLQITIDTAVDALSHLIEGYFSKRSTAASDLVALQGIALWGTAISALREGNLNRDIRRNLLLASSLGGITIAQTGTTLVHALGYSLTYYHGYPHGRANGVLFAEYLRYTAGVALEKVQTVLDLLGLSSVDEFADVMNDLFSDYAGKLGLSETMINSYVKKAMQTKNVGNSLGNPSAKELTRILEAIV
ncbi:MAG: iron-containing alcohol dehydrogenase family protein [Bacillota bacterium]|nr:iron-containing alcohol dehydrogenase family protein [Bacillota bacterium]